jgi:hypothetical protein
MQECEIRIHRDLSWAEIATSAKQTIDAKKGDLIVQLIFDAPPVPDDNPAVYKDLSAIWVISKGFVRPVSGWVDQLQHKPPPISSPLWMNC